MGQTLGRWMAFRIAELMQEAENGSLANRRAAKQECTNLVFRLWEHREKMFPGRPLGEIIDAFEALVEDPQSAPRRPRLGPPSWQSTFGELRTIQRQEAEIWRDAALLGISKEAAAKWLKQNAVPLSPHEKRLAAIFQRRVARELKFNLPDLEPDSPPAKSHSMALTKLLELQTQRAALIAKLTTDATPSSPKSASPKASKRPVSRKK